MNFIRALLTCALILVLSGLAFAGGQADGKTLYRNNCKVCHDKGSRNGQFAPMTLSQQQWRTFFTAKLARSHAQIVHPTEKKKVLELLSPDQLKAIQRFCIDHALDSEQPATCG